MSGIDVNGKIDLQPSSSGGGGAVAIADITDWPALVSATEVGYLDGVTSAIQTQLTAKAPLASPTFTGTVTSPATTQTGALQWTGTQTSAGASIANIFRSASTLTHNVASGFRHNFTINGTSVKDFYAGYSENFTPWGSNTARVAGSSLGQLYGQSGSISLESTTGQSVNLVCNNVNLLAASSTKLTSSVPLELSTNGLGTSSAVYFGKDATGAVVNVGSAGGGGGLQVFSGGTVNMALNETYGELFYVNQTLTASGFNQIARTSNGISIHSQAGQTNRSKVAVTSIGTSFTTIASLSGFTQALIFVNVVAKGTILLEWDGTTLTKLAGVASLTVAGSAGAGETAFRASGGNLQGIADVARNGSASFAIHH